MAVRRLPPGGAVFLANLRAGGTLAEAALAAMQETARFDLAENLAGLMSAQLVAGSSRSRHFEKSAGTEVAAHMATEIEPSRLSTITGECRYSIFGGLPYFSVTKAFHSSV